MKDLSLASNKVLRYLSITKRKVIILWSACNQQIKFTVCWRDFKPKQKIPKDMSIFLSKVVIRDYGSIDLHTFKDLVLAMLLDWKSTKPHLCSKFAISKCSNRCWECCHYLVLFTHIYHIWELSNEVLYDLIPKAVRKNTTGQS